MGVERREASREGTSPKAARLNLPGDSALGVEGTSGHTFPELCPPLAESPFCYILNEDLNPSRKNGRSHTSLLLTGVRGGVSTFDIPKKRKKIHT